MATTKPPIKIPPKPAGVQRITPEVVVADEPRISADDIFNRIMGEAETAQREIARPSSSASSGIASIAQRPPSNTSIALARELFRSGNYDLTDAGLTEWATLIENQGLESALSTWQAKGARGTVTPEFAAAVGDMPEFQQISPEQARSIAEQFVIYGTQNVQTMEDLDDLTNYIQDFGVDAALTRLREQGADVALLRGEVVPDDIARDFVNALYEGSGYSTANFNNWLKLTKEKGIDAALEQWKSVGNKGGKLSADQLTDFKTKASEGLQGLTEGLKTEFESNIDKILAGEDLTPALGFDITPQDFTKKLFLDAGQKIDTANPTYQMVLGMAEKYGPEVAQASFNRMLGVYDMDPASVQAPLEEFVPNTAGTGAGADIYGGITGTGTGTGTGAGADIYGERSNQPTINLPAQQPQAGLPSALPGPRTFVTPTDRPTLSPQTQYIGAPSVYRGAGEPMQPFVPSQFGLTTLTPAQYAEAARAAAIQDTGGVPVAPFSTPVTTTEGMKEGGLASAAKRLESKGRNGDSMLVHMTPDEVAGLQQIAMRMGGSLSINPQTGLPEANFFKKILPFVAAVAAPYLAPGLLGAGIAGGLATAGTMLGGGSLKEGLAVGLSAFGAAGLSSGAMGSNPLGVGGESTFNLANTFGPANTGNIGVEAGGVQTGGVTADELLAGSGRGMTQAPIEQLSQVPATVTPSSASSGTILGMKPGTALVGGMMASSLYAGEQERKAYERQYEDYLADVAARKKRGLESFERSSMPMLAASGGLMSLAGGGITYAEGGGTTGPTTEPRMVKGNGDGMSDSVPATIEGVQEARLANDEFVIPADVVADLGNGSSSAGAKQLYGMMDRVRRARHGTTEQPPEINAMKLMPA